MQEYTTRLAGSLGPLESSLRGLAKAKGYRGLDGKISGVEYAAAQAESTLSPIIPPADLAGEHSTLVTALQAFQDDLGDIGGKVVDRKLCTGSAARAGLGNADGTSGLRDAVAALSA